MLERLQASPHLPLSKALLQTIQGISPILARELADRVCRGEDPHAAELTAGQQGALAQTLQLLMRCLTAHQPHYTVLLEGGKPKDFSFFPIRQYGDYLEQKTFATAGELLDYFYVERDRIARMKQRSHDLIKLLNNTAERISRKLDLQQQELDQSAKRDEFRVYGELLNANLYRLQKGQTQALVENFYQENKPVSIPLDPLLTPAQNAQKYFNSYKKAVHAEKKLTSLVEQSQQDLAYIQSVLDLVLRTGSETELRELRQELAEQGYLKQKQLPGKTLGASQPICYRSSDGFLIRCGRNNKQNDALTFRLSKGDDLWLHVKNIPGSHVVIQSGGRPIPDRTIQEGCVLAAYNSKARESAQVPVDYTFVRYVKKPNGAKPGMVIFTNQRTAYVTPSAQLEQQLREPTDG